MVSSIVEVITTVERMADASAYCSALVELRLIACAQVDGPIMSVYRWQGQMETSQEYRLTMKTCTSKLDSVLDWIRKNHSYSTPQVVIRHVDTTPDYLSWVRESVGESSSF
jgi:periplasmic divalent cation tolerance protein